MELNQPASDFELPDLDGKIYRLRDYRGSIVIVNFWSAECPHSERVDRDLMTCLPGWRKNVYLLSIAANAYETDEAMTTGSRKRGLTPILNAKGTTVVKEYGAQTTPHLFVVDRLGILRYRGGYDDVNFRQHRPTRFFLRDAVSALLEGHLPDPSETPAFGCAISGSALE